MIIAECFFLDVGQGAAQVVHTREGHTIVIDCGRRSHILQSLLSDYLGVRRISALILSHNDVDHIGGLPGLIRSYRNRIDSVFFLQDRSAKELKKSVWFQALVEASERGDIPAPCRLELDVEARYLYPRHRASGGLVRVEILFPTFAQNIAAQATGTPNASSAVILVHCGRCRVLFPGDSPLATWEAIRRARGCPIDCDVLMVPHHGGSIGGGGQLMDDELEWFCFEAISCWYAIISVGTNNPYGHPRPEHVQALRLSGAEVICTEITKRCYANPETLQPGVLAPQEFPGLSKEVANNGSHDSGTAVACAGTILVQMRWDEVEVQMVEEHENAVLQKLVSKKAAPPCVGHP